MNAVNKRIVVAGMLAVVLTLSAVGASGAQIQAQSEDIRAILAAIEHSWQH
jgi:hypothetical protein